MKIENSNVFDESFFKESFKEIIIYTIEKYYFDNRILLGNHDPAIIKLIELENFLLEN